MTTVEVVSTEDGTSFQTFGGPLAYRSPEPEDLEQPVDVDLVNNTNLVDEERETESLVKRARRRPRVYQSAFPGAVPTRSVRVGPDRPDPSYPPLAPWRTDNDKPATTSSRTFFATEGPTADPLRDIVLNEPSPDRPRPNVRPSLAPRPGSSPVDNSPVQSGADVAGAGAPRAVQSVGGGWSSSGGSSALNSAPSIRTMFSPTNPVRTDPRANFDPELVDANGVPLLHGDQIYRTAGIHEHHALFVVRRFEEKGVDAHELEDIELEEEDERGLPVERHYVIHHPGPPVETVVEEELFQGVKYSGYKFHARPEHPEQAIQRARLAVGNPAPFSTSNCEHYVSYWRTGDLARSEQSSTFASAGIGAAVGSSAALLGGSAAVYADAAAVSAAMTAVGVGGAVASGIVVGGVGIVIGATAVGITLAVREVQRSSRASEAVEEERRKRANPRVLRAGERVEEGTARERPVLRTRKTAKCVPSDELVVHGAGGDQSFEDALEKAEQGDALGEKGGENDRDLRGDDRRTLLEHGGPPEKPVLVIKIPPFSPPPKVSPERSIGENPVDEQSVHGSSGDEDERLARPRPLKNHRLFSEEPVQLLDDDDLSIQNSAGEASARWWVHTLHSTSVVVSDPEFPDGGRDVSDVDGGEILHVV